MDKVDITIIGAGAIGLATAYELSKIKNSILLIEKNSKFGQETSSRNSEVIHAGIYYPQNSLKAKLCVEGKALLYEFLKQYKIPFLACGKYIIAVDKTEIEQLHALGDNGKNNGVEDLIYLNKAQLSDQISLVNGEEAIFSPSTGIFDTHKYMQKLESIAKANDVLIQYNTEVIGIEKSQDYYKLVAIDTRKEKFEFYSQYIINCAGLNCEKIAQLISIDTIKEGYKIYFAKGEYYRLPGKYKNLFSSLIYPVVPSNFKSLGIHTIIDLDRMLRLGPNAYYVDEIDYSIDSHYQDEFYEAVRRYLPQIKKEELYPDTVGIRPKLQGPNDKVKDFIIKEESQFPGFINLIGIESPGLTSSLAISKYIKNLIF